MTRGPAYKLTTNANGSRYIEGSSSTEGLPKKEVVLVCKKEDDNVGDAAWAEDGLDAELRFRRGERFGAIMSKQEEASQGSWKDWNAICHCTSNSDIRKVRLLVEVH